MIVARDMRTWKFPLRSLRASLSGEENSRRIFLLSPIPRKIFSRAEHRIVCDTLASLSVRLSFVQHKFSVSLVRRSQWTFFFFSCLLHFEFSISARKSTTTSRAHQKHHSEFSSSLDVRKHFSARCVAFAVRDEEKKKLLESRAKGVQWEKKRREEERKVFCGKKSNNCNGTQTRERKSE